MEVLYDRCAGIDVHKKNVVVCVVKSEKGRGVWKKTRTFSTFTRGLLEMSDWLVSEACKAVAMESTGVYWKPVYNILEGLIPVELVNAKDYKAVPGRKTDVKDCEWLADLLRHGLVKGSFIPPKEIRELRDLTRYRTKLIEDMTRVKGRIQKVLEDANIKLASVASDPLGVSGVEIIKAMIKGEEDPSVLAEMSRRRLRKKIPELCLALQGRLTDHHRFLLKELICQLEYLEGKIKRADAKIEEYMLPFTEEVDLLLEVPGLCARSIQNTIAEIGVDMSQFKTCGHISSWGGLSPGNNESAGKRYSGKTRDGNKWLKRTLVQVAWSLVRSNTYFSALYRRIVPRRGKKRAIVAVAHSLLVVIYHILKHRVRYHELGSDYFEKRNSEEKIKYLVKGLERFGYNVILEELPIAA